ncbi:bifunctional riboflavin kinase/FAD synthetase [Oceanobacillus jeddahense]|uniref:Riboflavin biosynthesis protein n=1 Tax=Oceanobacillus jeddahense TaxID=1462527 RepID=A0ABY5JMG8_9BACI|nr:bifunctional riboflavin kinase/FAD synthetase [Oceanobacillus jeddahense]UUI01500.1 bifunctional riboflavin kinase/FAD synthetase [Oceanobacillus jeddahense]
METIELSYPHTLSKEDLPETVSAIGFFDGIHKGHQRVIQQAVDKAKQKNMESAVITFFPHPSVVLRKDTQHVKYITISSEKQAILDDLQVDRLYIIQFNQDLSKLSPQEFIDHFIIGLNIKHLVAGFDYSFGHKGQGKMADMQDYARDVFTWETIGKVTLEKEKISSTRIRAALATGDMEQVEQLLGRTFKTTGLVVKGASRGRELGYPTANLAISKDALLPKQGVYATRVYYKGEVYGGMANIGTNPTFTDEIEDMSVEVFLFDFDGDLYGEELMIEWLSYTREEIKFDSKEALIERMQQDEQEIRAYLQD